MEAIHIEPKTREELADEYRVSLSTIRRRCKEFGIKGGRLLNTLQVTKLYMEMGPPSASYDGEDFKNSMIQREKKMG